jgi:hypothetical protein
MIPNMEDAPSAIHPGSRVVFYQGYNDVPVDLADHNYLFDAGAYRAGDDGKPESAEARGTRMRAARDKARGNQTKDRPALIERGAITHDDVEAARVDSDNQANPLTDQS